MQFKFGLDPQRICKSEILLSEIILPDLSLFLCGFLGLNCHFLLFSSLDNRNSPDLKKALRWILLTKRTTLPRNVFLSSSQMSQRHFIPEAQICEPKANLRLVPSLFWATLQPGNLFLPLDNLSSALSPQRALYLLCHTSLCGWKLEERVDLSLPQA